MPLEKSFPQRRLYGRRQTRPLKEGQHSALKEFLPSLKIDIAQASSLIEPHSLFSQHYEEIWLEVGFGSGEHLLEQAEENPLKGFIGCEPYMNGAANFLKKFSTKALSNIRLFMDDALLLLKQLESSSLSRVFILFPDPWPKKRHHRRRFIQKDTLDELHRVLKQKGSVYIATDHADYLEWILLNFQEDHRFTPLRTQENIFEKPAKWPQTRYEQKAALACRKSAYMIYENTLNEECL